MKWEDLIRISQGANLRLTCLFRHSDSSGLGLLDITFSESLIKMLWRCIKIDSFETQLLIFPSFIVYVSVPLQNGSSNPWLALTVQSFKLEIRVILNYSFTFTTKFNQAEFCPFYHQSISGNGPSLLPTATCISSDFHRLSFDMYHHLLNHLLWSPHAKHLPSCNLCSLSKIGMVIAVGRSLREPLHTFPLQILLTSCLLSIW